MIVIDEFSMASQHDVILMEEKIRYLKDCTTVMYGNVEILFCGDMRQLEPVDKRATRIYQYPFPQFHGAVNCCLELHGMHRFADDPEWGLILMRFRNGQLTENDIDVINTRVITEKSQIPQNMTYGTYKNKDCASINCGLFLKYIKTLKEEDLENCLLVLSCTLKVKSGTNVYKLQDNLFEKFFWENCGEGDCNKSTTCGQFDPVLQLYFQKPMMVTSNFNVSNRIANGTRSYVWKIHLRNGVKVQKVWVHGLQVPAVRAHQITAVTMEYEDSDEFFELQPVNHYFKASVPFPDTMQVGGTPTKHTLDMQGIQLPIICNNATTGHKLQGATIEKLFVHCNSRVQNWMYVVLARVKTQYGLYLRSPLSKKHLAQYNKIPESLKEMVAFFQNNRMQVPFQENDYQPIFGTEYDLLLPLNR